MKEKIDLSSQPQCLLVSSADTDTDLSDSTKNLQIQTDSVTSELIPNLTQSMDSQQQLIEDNRQLRQCLQRHDAAIEHLIQLVQRLTETQEPSSFIKPVTLSPNKNNCEQSFPMSSMNQSTKQLRSKQISQLLESKSFSGSPTQDVVDWLDEFNHKCDDIILDDTQRLSIARNLLTDDAKLWMETLKISLIDWSSFQKKLIAYFQLAAGIDIFSFNEQLYTRQQQLHETAIHYYHDVMRLCSKVNVLMDNSMRLRHLYRGLRPESKVLISINTFQSPDEFLEELVRLEHLQTVSDYHQSTSSPFTIAQPNSGNAIMTHQPYSNYHNFQQQPSNLHLPNHPQQGSRSHQPSTQYRSQRPQSNHRQIRHLNA